MAAIDPYYYATEAYGPARRLFAIAPNDGVDLLFVTTGIYVGATGNLSVIDRDTGTAVTFEAVPAGTILPIRVARVRATGTSASALVGMA